MHLLKCIYPPQNFSSALQSSCSRSWEIIADHSWSWGGDCQIQCLETLQGGSHRCQQALQINLLVLIFCVFVYQHTILVIFFFLVKRAIKESIRPVCRERRKENSWGEGRILLVECVALTRFYIKIWCGVHYRNVEIKSKGLHPSSSRFFLCFHLFSFPSFLPSSLSLSISFSLPLWCGIVSHQASSLRWCLNPPAAFSKNLIRSFYEECPLTLDVSL